MGGRAEARRRGRAEGRGLQGGEEDGPEARHGQARHGGGLQVQGEDGENENKGTGLTGLPDGVDEKRSTLEIFIPRFSPSFIFPIFWDQNLGVKHGQN